MLSDFHAADFFVSACREPVSHISPTFRLRIRVCLEFCLTSTSDVANCPKTASFRYLPCANENPPLGIVELRPENPLLLASRGSAIVQLGHHHEFRRRLPAKA